MVRPQHIPEVLRQVRRLLEGAKTWRLVTVQEASRAARGSKRPKARIVSVLLIAVLSLIQVGFARGDTLLLTPIADTRISPGEDANWNHLNSIAVYNEPGNVQRGLFQFDLSAIPAGARITSATLRLTERDTFFTSQGRPTYAFRVTRPWSETQATGIRATASTFWTFSGGDFVGTTGFQDTSPYAVAFDIGTAPLLFMDLTSLVQAWVEDGLPNYGMLLRAPVGNHLHFCSREFGLPKAPLLTIEYELGLPDLIASNLIYTVREDDTLQPLGPLPENGTLDVTVDLSNLGYISADNPTVKFYLSTSPVVSPNSSTELLIIAGTNTVESLDPGSTVRLTVSLSAPLPLPREFWGTVYLGTIVDPENQLTEIDEANNQNQGEGIDRWSVQLYDPIWPRRDLERTFGNSLSASLFLVRQGFGYFPLGDVGYSRDIDAGTFSRFNGVEMPLQAFRLQAFISESGPPFRINIQGVWSYARGKITAHRGEPNPRTAVQLELKFPGWFGYVLDYHKRF